MTEFLGDKDFQWRNSVGIKIFNVGVLWVMKTFSDGIPFVINIFSYGKSIGIDSISDRIFRQWYFNITIRIFFTDGIALATWISTTEISNITFHWWRLLLIEFNVPVTEYSISDARFSHSELFKNVHILWSNFFPFISNLESWALCIYVHTYLNTQICIYS